MSIHLVITNQTRSRLDTRRLGRQLRRTLKLLKIRHANWSITIVADRAMSALHALTMKDPTTTDVLTFDLRDESEIKKTKEGSAVELDTVICRDEAARRAKEFHHTTLEELLLYAIHSLLHVQGYDDLRNTRAAQMHRREDELLIALGIGPVYAAKAKRSSPRIRP